MATKKESKKSNKVKAKAGTQKTNDQLEKRVLSKKRTLLGTGDLVLACFMLVAGLLTPPLASKYCPALIPFLSIFQVGKRIDVDIKSSKEEVVKPSPPDNEETNINFVECNEDNVSKFYHEERNDGVHILCFSKKNSLKVYEDSHDEFPISVNLKRWQEFKDVIIEGTFDISSHDISNSQPWAVFSINGERLVGELDGENGSIDILKQHGMVVLFEGGQWVWPGVRIGYKRHIDVVTGYPTNGNITSLEIETLSMKPLVVSVQNFILENECDHIQKTAEPQMMYSEVSLMDKDKGRSASDFRTSQSAFLVANDEIMHALEERTSSLVRIPKNHQEHTQVLRYGYQEKYLAHLDWFDPQLYQEDQHTLRLIEHGKKNRLATVFWYLSDVEGGGHTVFPRFNGAPQPYDFGDCTKGLLVKPEKGKVIIFYSLLPDGTGDELSLHGACPVKEGIKWAANKWVWNAPVDFLR